MNAADYGVPQTQNRTIGLCVYGEDEEKVQIPSPTHSKDSGPDSGLRKWVTLAETIERPSLQEELELGKAQEDDYAHRARRHRQSTIDMMEAIRKHGDSWMDLEGTEDEDQIRDCHQSLTSSGAGSAYGILRGEEPAPTLTTRCTNPSSGRYTHHKQNRGLSPREAALLMTFPPKFELPEKNSAAERVVGNAVPPRLVNQMARALF